MNTHSTKKSSSIESIIRSESDKCMFQNQHFNKDQLCDYVYFKIFGKYNGSEKDKRNMFLIKKIA